MAVITEEQAITPLTEDPKSITILGSTGSVGCQTIDLIVRDRGRYTVEALTANGNVDRLIEQARSLRPKYVAIADEKQYQKLADSLRGSGITVGAGEDGVIEAACRPAEWVMAAIVGAAGLKPTLNAVRRGVTVALANKECLVCAGDLFMREVGRHHSTLLPVDSEHNAIFQVFDFERIEGVEKLILTASGGPFRNWQLEDMEKATPAQAVAHPNWNMGAKISVDSATMMNKGLEIIEAHHIFGIPENRIDVLVHPQSVIHSMVSYVDGSVLAQLGTPDMRTPIAYSLAWPSRIHTPAARLDLSVIGSLQFGPPDLVRFPALKLAREALRRGGETPTILNAANEIAVAAFLDGRIGFLDIAYIVEKTLDALNSLPIRSIDDVFEVDGQARRLASDLVVARP